mmetsp:Transcript_6032/g.23948  ORF Transcript_6032/g.23948 Transcript_6032/m.23948 type:complete len:203 (+) Transcript_6032:340-948(+)
MASLPPMVDHGVCNACRAASRASSSRPNLEYKSEMNTCGAPQSPNVALYRSHVINADCSSFRFKCLRTSPSMDDGNFPICVVTYTSNSFPDVLNAPCACRLPPPAPAAAAAAAEAAIIAYVLGLLGSTSPASSSSVDLESPFTLLSPLSFFVDLTSAALVFDSPLTSCCLALVFASLGAFSPEVSTLSKYRTMSFNTKKPFS